MPAPVNKLKLRINPVVDKFEGNTDFRWELLCSKGLLLCTSRKFEREGFARQSAFAVYGRMKAAFEKYDSPESIPLKRKKK